MTGPVQRLRGMTAMLLTMMSAPEPDVDVQQRCDVCGERVSNPRAHLAVCVQNELTMFAIGRRAS